MTQHQTTADIVGLIDACQVLKEVRGIAFTQFSSIDVVRHPLVGRIVDAYQDANELNSQHSADIGNLKQATPLSHNPHSSHHGRKK